MTFELAQTVCYGKLQFYYENQVWMEHFQYIVMLDYQRVQLLMFNGGLMVQWCDCFMNHHDDWKYRVMKQPDGLKECDWTCGFITIMMLKIPRSSKVYTSVQWFGYEVN